MTVEDWRCEHERIELRYKDTVDGRRQYREQCLTCGSLIRHVKKKEVSPNSEPNIRPYDDTLQRLWWRSRSELYEHQRQQQMQAEQARWWKWYSEYLQSQKWKEKRQLIIERSHGVCEGCETAAAVQVHHLTYERVGDELLFDLVAVCANCHQRAHPNKPINTRFEHGESGEGHA